MSINTHLQREQSRRDDLEALGYVLIYFLKGRLPWQGITVRTKEERNRLIGGTKQGTTVQDLCEGCPAEFNMFLQRVHDLGFEDCPPYDSLRHLLVQALKNSGGVDNDRYDWDEKTDDKQIVSSQKADDIRSPLQKVAPRVGTVVSSGKREPAILNNQDEQSSVTGQERQLRAPRDKPQTRKREPTLLSPGQFPRPSKRTSRETLSTTEG